MQPKIKSNVSVTGIKSTFLNDSKKMHKSEESSVDKLNASLTTLEKVLDHANKMMASMVQVSDNNLETERLKLKRLEMQQREKTSR